MRRRLPQLVCGLFGVALFVLHFLRGPETGRIYQILLVDYYQIIFAFTLIVGVTGFVRINVKSIQAGKETAYRVVSLVGLVAMVLFAIVWGIKGDSPFMWTFNNIQVPMQSTVFALLAFFVASASLRGFRARSVPAAILLLSALLTLLSRSDLGGFLSGWLPDTAEWIRNNPSMSARRAILIGIGLGSLTTSLRVILGIERTWLGGEK